MDFKEMSAMILSQFNNVFSNQKGSITPKESLEKNQEQELLTEMDEFEQYRIKSMMESTGDR